MTLKGKTQKQKEKVHLRKMFLSHNLFPDFQFSF
jgi:hypothetical protein